MTLVAFKFKVQKNNTETLDKKRNLIYEIENFSEFAFISQQKASPPLS